MLPFKICGVSRYQHFNLFSPNLHPIFQSSHDRKSMLFKRSPGKTAFEQERCNDQVQVPWAENCKKVKWQSEQNCSGKPEDHTKKTLEPWEYFSGLPHHPINLPRSATGCQCECGSPIRRSTRRAAINTMTAAVTADGTVCREHQRSV